VGIKGNRQENCDAARRIVMKERSAVVPVLLLTATICLFSRSVAAEPIQIVDGFLRVMNTRGTISLVGGERGFTLSAVVSAQDGVFQPYLHCSLLSPPPCLPNTPIDLGAFWVGSSLRDGVVTLDGRTFTGFGGANSETSAGVRFMGSALAPPLEVGDTATVAGPFLFDGTFLSGEVIDPITGQPLRESLVGGGTATLSLHRIGGPGSGLPPAWGFTASQYQFDPIPVDPIPEPGTLMLTGAGLAAIVARRVRRGAGVRRAAQTNVH
jgi:hypothetical protein